MSVLEHKKSVKKKINLKKVSKIERELFFPLCKSLSEQTDESSKLVFDKEFLLKCALCKNLYLYFLVNFVL